MGNATPNMFVIELGKWTKPMLIDFILNKTHPSGVKVSDGLLLHLNSNNLGPESSENTANMATILQSVVIELKHITESNRLINVKLNGMAMDSNSTGTSSSDKLSQVVKHVPTISAVSVTSQVNASVRTKFIVGSGSPATSGLFAVSTQKFSDLFVSRFNPDATTDLLKSELFAGFDDFTVTQMVTKHPTYASFHIHLPLEKLQDVLEPSFWPDGVIFKRFWGRLQPGMMLNSKNSKN